MRHSQGMSTQTAVAWITLAEPPLPHDARIAVHPRAEVAEALAARPELGAGLVVLDLRARGWAVASASQPDAWHQVIVAEHGEMVGARCTCTAGSFAGRRPVGCSHTAAVLRRRLTEVEVVGMGMSA